MCNSVTRTRNKCKNKTVKLWCSKHDNNRDYDSTDFNEILDILKRKITIQVAVYILEKIMTVTERIDFGIKNNIRMNTLRIQIPFPVISLYYANIQVKKCIKYLIDNSDQLNTRILMCENGQVKRIGHSLCNLKSTTLLESLWTQKYNDYKL